MEIGARASRPLFLAPRKKWTLFEQAGTHFIGRYTISPARRSRTALSALPPVPRRKGRGTLCTPRRTGLSSVKLSQSAAFPGAVTRSLHRAGHYGASYRSVIVRSEAH